MLANKGTDRDERGPHFMLELVRDVIRKEARALHDLVDIVDVSYLDALDVISNRRGKVVLTGMGKSGLIARKIAATMSSTGTFAVFLHPAEAAHGDIGMVAAGDVVIAVGKSGESEELNTVLPVIKRIGAKIIAITGNRKSTLAKRSDVVLYAGVKEEACPFDLAPTTSTTVALAIGDALAMALMKMKNFEPDDFALYHPGGRLGRRLLLQVADILVPIEECPTFYSPAVDMKEIIMALSKYRLGIVLFLDKTDGLEGILTDGDIRRLLDKHGAEVFQLEVRQVLNSNPISIQKEIMAVEALKIMEQRERPLNVLPVMDQGRCIGIIRLHELLRVV